MDALKDAAARVVVAHEQLHGITQADAATWLDAMATALYLIADEYDELHRVLSTLDLDSDIRKALGIALSDAALWRRDWAYKDEMAAHQKRVAS
jgi:truncated hemoglobin YjbI